MTRLAYITLRWEVERTYQVSANTIAEAKDAAVEAWREDVAPYADPAYNGFVPDFAESDNGHGVPTWEPDGFTHASWWPCAECNSTGAVPAANPDEPQDNGYAPCPACNTETVNQ